MKNIIKRIAAIALSLMMLLSPCPFAMAEDEASDVTILFTHDLHSHFLPSNEDDGGQFGGYARLMTAIKEQKAKYLPEAAVGKLAGFALTEPGAAKLILPPSAVPATIRIKPPISI